MGDLETRDDTKAQKRFPSIMLLVLCLILISGEILSHKGKSTRLNGSSANHETDVRHRISTNLTDNQKLRIIMSMIQLYYIDDGITLGLRDSSYIEAIKIRLSGDLYRLTEPTRLAIIAKDDEIAFYVSTSEYRFTYNVSVNSLIKMFNRYSKISSINVEPPVIERIVV